MGFGKDGKGAILYDQVTINPGTLAAHDVIAGNSTYVGIEQDFRILKSEFYMDFAPQAVGDNVLVGIAGGNLSAAAIESAIEARPLEANSLLMEESMRAVWPLVNFGENSTGSGRLVANFEKNLRWTFRQDDGWVYWVFNTDDSAALTDASEISIFAKHFGLWVN